MRAKAVDELGIKEDAGERDGSSRDGVDGDCKAGGRDAGETVDGGDGVDGGV